MAHGDVLQGLDTLFFRLEQCAGGEEVPDAEALYTDGCATALLLEAERRRLRRAIAVALADGDSGEAMASMSQEFASKLHAVAVALDELRQLLTRAQARQ